MSPQLCVSVSLAILLAACASTDDSSMPTKPVADAGQAPDAGRDDAAGESGKVAPANAAEATASAQGGEQEQGPSSEDKQLLNAIWRDPAFRISFVNSYLRDSSVEPSLTAREFELMEEVAELRRDGEEGRALDRLLGRQTEDCSAAIDFTIGQLHFENGRFAEAERAYLTAVGDPKYKFPKFKRAWRMLAMTRMRLENFPGAAAAFVKVLELGGGDKLVYGLLGFCHGKAEDYIAAESAYRMAAMMEPSRPQWRLGLARTFFKQRRYAEAQALTSAMIEDNPQDTSLWMLRANALVQMREVTKAADVLELVDQLGASTYDSLALLGDIYINEGMPDLAADAYLRGLAKGDGSARARAMTAAGQLAARSAYQACARLLDGIEGKFGADMPTEDKKGVLKLRARLAVATGASDEEISVLNDIVKLDPMDGDALILLGQYYTRQGEPERAVMRFEQAAGLPNFAAEAKLQHGRLLASEGNYAKALPLLRDAQKLRPSPQLDKFIADVEKVVGRGK